VDVLMDLASSASATVEARAAAEWGLRRISGHAGSMLADAGAGSGAADEAHAQLVVADIQRFMERRFEGGERSDALAPPPGTPIGSRR
jgi:hypothetical protein